MQRKKDSPDFKTDINSLISSATDTRSCEDGSITQSSSPFCLTILCGERWFAREGVGWGVVCWWCPDKTFLNSTLLMSSGYHTTDSGNSGKGPVIAPVPTWGKQQVGGSCCSCGHDVTLGPPACLSPGFSTSRNGGIPGQLQPPSPWMLPSKPPSPGFSGACGLQSHCSGWQLRDCRFKHRQQQ